MLTRIDPVHTYKGRTVENTDSHMHLQHEEQVRRDKQRHDKEKQTPDNTLWDDRTEVSVEGLLSFLTSLLDGGLSVPPEDNFAASDTAQPVLIKAAANADTKQDVEPEIPTARALASQKATRAYQATGRQVHDKNIYTQEKNLSAAANTAPAFALGDDFDLEQRQQLIRFIADLQDLRSRGRNVLVLQRNLTFLESINQAIKGVKTLNPAP